MTRLRHYFVSDDLDELEILEQQLETAGVSPPQIHVLSQNDADVERHRLHEVQSLMKKDIVGSTKLGAVVGICAFALALAAAYFAGWTKTAVGWTPFVFLAIVLLGFCAWEGGLIGIETTNRKFARFEKALTDGKHVFFVDLDPREETLLEDLLKAHPRIERAGTGSPAPRWLIALQHRVGMFRHL